MTGAPEFLATAIHIGGFKWTGDFTLINLIAASTNERVQELGPELVSIGPANEGTDDDQTSG
jgi:hypothetical protein